MYTDNPVLNRSASLDDAPQALSNTETPATNVELVASLGDTGALRGVTEASADLAECTCPEPCERDHANE